MDLAYLDHNIIVMESVRLRAIFAPGTGLRVAVSVWNLVEIAKHGDRAEAIRRATLADGLAPTWLFNARDLQSEEVLGFLLREYFKVDVPPWSPFSPSLSAVMWNDMAAHRPIVGGAAGWVREHHGKLPAIDQGDQMARAAITTRQTANLAARKAAEPETFRQWVTAKVENRLPFKVPGHGAITLSEIPKLVEFCWDHRDAFYAACPSMAVEDQFAEFRARDKGRHAQLSDGRDLQHAISALPYCRHLVSGDGYLRSCAAYAQKQLPLLRLASVHRNLDEFQRSVTAHQPAA